MYLVIVGYLILTYFVVIKGILKERQAMELFTDNGNRVKLDINVEEWKKISGRDRVECSEKRPVTCNISSSAFDCFHCNEILASCIHFDNDEVLYSDDGVEVGIIPKNSSKTEGYCLRMNGKERRTCSSVRGGKWIVAKNDENRFAYVCYCSTPSIFDNTSFFSDCTEFKGCSNGTIKPGWHSLSDIECDCNQGYSFEREGIHPICKRKNHFYTSSDKSIQLKREHIDPNYRGANLNLPNPCLIDARTGKLAVDAGKLTMLNGIAFCEAISELFTTVAFEDDYLIGNGGKYANAIVSVSSEAPLHGTIYETRTKKRDGSLYPIFEGRRYRLDNFLFKLPYTDSSSANLGGGGPYFPFAASISRRWEASIYVYKALSPIEPTFIVGVHNSFIPTFVHHLESKNRHYTGNVAFKRVPLQPCGTQNIIYLWKGILKERYPYFGISGYSEHFGVDPEKDTKLLRGYVAHPFCTRNNVTEINEYTATFTGIFLNTVQDNELHTAVICPGEYITTLYRMVFDEAWARWKNTNRFLGMIDKHPEMSVDADNAGLVNDGYDCSGISNPNEFTKYECTKAAFKWSSQY